MKTLAHVILITALSGTYAYADCEAPSEPKMPDGASASMQEMLDGQQSVKDFQSANMDYLKCLEAAFADAEKAAKAADDKQEAARAMAVYSEAVDAYNAAVSNEESIAGDFNTEIREYQAANADK